MGICLVGFASPSSELLNGVGRKAPSGGICAASIRKLWILYLADHSHIDPLGIGR